MKVLLVATAVFLAGAGCGFWPGTNVRTESEATQLSGKTIRLRQNGIVVHEIHDAVVEYPYVRGIETSPEGPRKIEFDLRKYDDHIDYYNGTRGAIMTTTGVVLGAAAITLVIGFVAISSTASNTY